MTRRSDPTDVSGCCDAPRLPATPPDPTGGGGGDLAGGSVYGGGHVPMIVINRNGARSMTDDAATNHYSLLQTIEQNSNTLRSSATRATPHRCTRSHRCCSTESTSAWASPSRGRPGASRMSGSIS